MKVVYTAGVVGETRHFYYAGFRIIEERKNTSSNAELHYVWGLRYVDDLICRDRDTSIIPDGTLDERIYALTDASFSITAIANAAGAILERYTYTPYGRRSVLTAAFAPQTVSLYNFQIGMQGLLHDTESGLIYNRARYLHPQLGRFIQRDPLGYVDGMSLYAGYHLMGGGLDPSGLLKKGWEWHHLAPKWVFDPDNPGSILTLLGMTLEEGINIHSAEYGWEMLRDDHSAIDRIAGSYTHRMAAWLRQQYNAGVRTITKEMLDNQIKEFQLVYGLKDKEGKILKGCQATANWAGRSKYFYEIRKRFGGTWGLIRFGSLAGKSLKVIIPGVGVLMFATNVKADGLILGTLNTISPIDTHTMNEIQAAFDSWWNSLTDAAKQKILDNYGSPGGSGDDGGVVDDWFGALKNSVHGKRR